MALRNGLIGSALIWAALWTVGCNGRAYIGLETYDKLHEERTTVDKPWYERVVGKSSAQMSGSN